jgi:AraC-like DNA-binding protein
LFAVVDAELCDPEFGTRRLARRLGISARYVQILFAEMATTPTAFIRGRRLALAARQLARDGASRTITDVAYAVGFNDLSSFCRAFRQRFDVSAREYRERGGEPGGTA